MCGYFNIALSGYDRLLRDYPNNSAYLYNTAGCLFKLDEAGNNNQIVELLIKACKLSPELLNDDWVVFVLPVSIHQSLEKEAGIMKPSVKKLFNQACELQADGMIEAAEEKLIKALEFDPKNEPCLTNLGCIYFERAEWSLALSYFMDAVKSSPNDANCQLNVGCAIIETECFNEEAKTHFIRAVQLDKNILDYDEWCQNNLTEIEIRDLKQQANKINTFPWLLSLSLLGAGIAKISSSNETQTIKTTETYQ